jgi:hypothetical protein
MAKAKWLSWVTRLLLAGAAVDAASEVAVDAAVHGMPEDQPRHPSVRFQPTDVNARYVFYTGVGVLAGTLLLVLLIFPYFQFLKAYRARAVEPPMASTGGQSQTPPEPRLQANPALDLQNLRREEDQMLNHSRWIDRGHGVVSLPVERAMEITVQRGIAPRKAPPGNVYFAPRQGSRETGFDGRMQEVR